MFVQEGETLGAPSFDLPLHLSDAECHLPALWYRIVVASFGFFGDPTPE